MNIKLLVLFAVLIAMAFAGSTESDSSDYDDEKAPRKVQLPKVVKKSFVVKSAGPPIRRPIVKSVFKKPF